MKLAKFSVSLISKTNLTSQTVQQIVTIHMLSNISRSKCNSTVKFGQSIEYKMRNFFLQKSYTKCSGDASYRHIYKKSKLCVSLDQQSEMILALL